MRLTEDQLDSLVRLSRTALPHEACGLLAGDHGVVREVMPLANVERNPAGCGWRADSREQYRAFERIDGQGWQLLAVCHSHPRAPAFPSERDVEHAQYADACYVVVSMLDPDAPDVRAFRIARGVVSDEPLVIGPAPTGTATERHGAREA